MPNDRPTIHMTTNDQPTIPVLGPVLELTRLQLRLPVGLSILLECGDHDRQVVYRVLDTSGRAVARGMFPTTAGAWLSLQDHFHGEPRVRLNCWLRGLR